MCLCFLPCSENVLLLLLLPPYQAFTSSCTGQSLMSIHNNLIMQVFYICMKQLHIQRDNKKAREKQRQSCQLHNKVIGTLSPQSSHLISPLYLSIEYNPKNFLYISWLSEPFSGWMWSCVIHKICSQYCATLVFVQIPQNWKVALMKHKNFMTNTLKLNLHTGSFKEARNNDLFWFYQPRFPKNHLLLVLM